MAKLNFDSNDYKFESGLWFTFDQWADNGFGVIKGEKSRRRINGVPVFHESQVLNLAQAAKQSNIRAVKYNPCFDITSDLDYQINCTMAGEFGFLMSDIDRFLDVDLDDGNHWTDAALR